MANKFYDKDFIRNCDEAICKKLYENQYDESQNIPEIDRVKEEVNIVYKFYIYENYDKYFCRVFPDKD